jgi:SnoaL-like domain
MTELTTKQIERVQDSLDRDDIRNLLALYPRAIDRCDENLLRTIYWPDAADNHGSFSGTLEEFIAWSFPQLRALDQTHHHTGNPTIAINGDQARSESYYIAYHQVGRHSTDRDYMIGGRYIDRLEKRAGEWRILARIATFDYNATCQGQPWANYGFSTPESIGARKPDDAVYRQMP